MQPESSASPRNDNWNAVYSLLNGKLKRSGECWEWTGYRMRHGHGQIRRSAVAQRAILVHRYVWSQLVGDVGEWFVLHRCDNPPCVRPSHLWLGTQGDNNRDMWAKGRGVDPPAQWDGIHCKRGHVIADNPYYSPSTGIRRCKTCMNEQGRIYMRTYVKKK